MRYEGFGPTLAAEKLGKEGYEVDHETLRRWLKEAGLWQRKRKRAEHRQRRERREHFGELVQMDGSPHPWLGEGQPQCCLLTMVDDATGITMVLLAEQETTEGAMRLLWQWIERYGVPQALYTDRKNVYITEREPSLEEQLQGKEPKTAFGLACERLDIEIIPANSPQAKGRVERKHGVFQDRFVRELQLEDITTIKAANELLSSSFVAELNEKFAREPREAADFHSKAPSRQELKEIFCWEEERVVCNDWTVQHKRQLYQITKHNDPLPRPKDRVVVRTLLDGTLKLLYHDKALRYKLLGEIQRSPQPSSKLPSAAHPWQPAPALAVPRCAG